LPYLAISGIGLYYFLNNDVKFYNDLKTTHSDFLDKTMSSVTLLGDGLVHLGVYSLFLIMEMKRTKR